MKTLTDSPILYKSVIMRDVADSIAVAGLQQEVFEVDIEKVKR